MAKYIMLQGTSSHVGKSVLTAALCRIFFQDGEKVVPFKAQNMALNSYVTKDGKEMGRAQVAQAEAAGLEPQVEMNPVLLKPTGNSRSQVILMGQPIGNMSAKEYHTGYSLKALDTVKRCLKTLDNDYETIVIEGAGSPAEINLKANDIVNMRIAKLLQAPVLLVADIDRGGALASVVGTLELLDDEEKDLIKGIIINKFRGDINLLKPALDFLEDKTGKPVIGVIPHLDNIGVDDEDSVSLNEKVMKKENADLVIAVLKTPKISNFTDFDSLGNEPDVLLKYIGKGEAIGKPDLLIIPGTKNTIEDLSYLYDNGYYDEIQQCADEDIPIIGICGGYQMLGQEVFDPHHMESNRDHIKGLGLLNTRTTFSKNKFTYQITATYLGQGFLGIKNVEESLDGYEIHMGKSEFLGEVHHAFKITNQMNDKKVYHDGLISDNGLVMGTYIHGIFDNDNFRRTLLNALRKRKNLKPLDKIINTYAQKQHSYNRLANMVRNSMKMDLIYKMMEK